MNKRLTATVSVLLTALIPFAPAASADDDDPVGWALSAVEYGAGFDPERPPCSKELPPGYLPRPEGDDPWVRLLDNEYYFGLAEWVDAYWYFTGECRKPYP